MQMYLVSTLLVALFSTVLQSSIDRAFTAAKSNDWSGAASALAEIFDRDPQTFEANNLHYLRGRVAENQNDWHRAAEEFNKIAAENPLHPLAIWHALRASVQLHDEPSNAQLLSALPRDFPVELKMRIAREAGGTLALKIYEEVSTREARLQQAKLLNDTRAMRELLRENKDDDVALEAARLVAPYILAPRDAMDIAQAFAAHRQFEQALPIFRTASTDPAYAADARYQTGRVYFQLQDYASAIEVYGAIARDFEGTDWQRDAEYQIALCYWRLADYRKSETAFLNYIRKYGSAGNEEAAVRNLVDVYRVLGENQKAIESIDRALMTRLSPITQQVLLFTKAKILYSENRYAAALALFQRLGQMSLRSAAGAATLEEVEYFQGLLQAKLGNKAAAETIWRKLAADEFSYYGQRAAEKLGRPKAGQLTEASTHTCLPDERLTAAAVEADLAGLRHPLRAEMSRSSDVVSELVFLGLWDEAALWMERPGSRISPRAAAEIAYLAGQYNRSIYYADRLPKSESTLPLLYPAGYRQTVCEAALAQNVDPVWLHAIIWQESKYNPNARSGAAARGLMQFIPETAHTVAASAGMRDLTLDMLYDPATSIRLGAKYWSMLVAQLNSPEMALAAYNGGPDNVDKWRSKSSDPELFVADIGFVETKKYVLSVFAAHAAYASFLK